MSSSPFSDPLLLPFFTTTEEAALESQKSDLQKEIDRIVIPILRRKLGFYLDMNARSHDPEAEDFYQKINLLIWQRMEVVRTDPDGKSITDFRDYVAVIAYNAIKKALLKSNRELYDLHNHTLDVLKNNRSFAVWENIKGEKMCGYASQQDSEPSFVQRRRIKHFVETPVEFMRGSLQNRDARKMAVGDLIAMIFDELRSPVKFADLMKGCAEILGIKRTALLLSIDQSLIENYQDPRSDVAVDFENKEAIVRFWENAPQLPVLERQALLLSLKDQHRTHFLKILEEKGLTTFDEIERTLALPPGKLEEIWNDLPLGNEQLGRLLGVSLGQVSKLRERARGRLKGLMSLVK